VWHTFVLLLFRSGAELAPQDAPDLVLRGVYGSDTVIAMTAGLVTILWQHDGSI
jgi:hypothetical protein